MQEFTFLLLRFVVSLFNCKATIQPEDPAVRYQLSVLLRNAKRPKIQSADRILWVCLANIRTRLSH